MSFMIAALVAFMVAGTSAAMLVGGATRRPATARLAAISTTDRQRRWVVPRFRRTTQVVRPSSLAAWADDLARSLRHGATLHAALANTLPADAVIERHSEPLRHWLDRGATVAAACDEWADDLADDEHVTRLGRARRRRADDRTELLETMAAVLAAAAALGGTVAAPLDRFAVTMRQRASDDLERAAHSAQAMMSAKVLTSVPLAVLALLLLTDANVRGIIASPSGGSVVALGLGLNTAGALWMRRIVAGSGRGAPC
ncbi:MAG: type II secretion system F family protein [Ilumatobacter sp.]|uniref:type II secretion system F family protein n=1 Tax=Ilumatobacter sp. TaxID=1967498 RepID=UPI003C75B71E